MKTNEKDENLKTRELIQKSAISELILSQTTNKKFASESLNEEQKLVKKIILGGQNIFFTGSAGTGKSFLLNHLITLLQEKHKRNQVGITSTTGKGAEIIGGTTLHSYLGVGIDSNLEQKILLTRIFSSQSRINWLQVKVLIVDEVGMLDGNLFDKLESIARKIRGNEKPFGGIQLVLVGDFCQLPPVGKTATYCFEAQSWPKCITHTVNLTQVYRQKRDWFVSYLQNIRFGRLSKHHWKILLFRLQREPNWPSDGIKPTILFPTRIEVGNINDQELAKLPGYSRLFLAQNEEKVIGESKKLAEICSVPEKLKLKIGAQVMLVINWHEEKLVNGSQGTVVGFTKAPDGPILPIVKFTNGSELVVEKHTWKKIEGYDKNNKPIITATRKQIPLILAWAITIHKSQGQTIERLKVDLSKCFMEGQAYVALSRAIDPEYLQIVNFPYRRLQCNPKVQQFYRNLSTVSTLKDFPIFDISWSRKTNNFSETVQERWKEVREKFFQRRKWPRKEIKKLLFRQDQEYFDHFLLAISKSASNSNIEDSVRYAQLTRSLQKWWRKTNNHNIKKKDWK